MKGHNSIVFFILILCFVALVEVQGLILTAGAPFAVRGEPFHWNCTVSGIPGGAGGIAFRLGEKKVCVVPLTKYPHLNCTANATSKDHRSVCGCHTFPTYYMNVSRTEMSDSGQWTCGYVFYAIRSQSVELPVYYGPGSSITIDPPKSNVSLKERSNFKLSCKASCLPSCQYQWYKDGRFLVNSSILNLDMVEDKDTGSYGCRAENVVSHGMTLIKVLVLDQPKIPRDLKHVTSSSSSVCLVWRTGDDGGASHLFHLQVAKASSNQSASLIWKDAGDSVDEPIYGGPVTACVHNLISSTSYYFRVYASNVHHTGNASLPIQASTLDAVTQNTQLSFGSGMGVGMTLGLVLMSAGVALGVIVINKRKQQRQDPIYNIETDYTSLVHDEEI